MWDFLKWAGIVFAALVIGMLLYVFVFLGGPQGLEAKKQALTARELDASVNVVRISLELYHDHYGTYATDLATLAQDTAVSGITTEDTARLGASATYRTEQNGRDYQLCVSPADTSTPECFTSETPMTK